ncbi:MAG: hypothetical protein O3C51_18425 [Planctomycetota bacterium]|nr:hypothetical protein [Planctomycetota bacterium]
MTEALCETVARGRAGGDSSARVRAWELPHLLALDAVAVALAWQAVLAESVAAHVTTTTRVALGAIVWTVYLLDRLWDQRGDAPPTARHAFTARFGRLLAGLAVSSALLALAAAFRVPQHLVAPGLGVGIVVLAYFVWVHVGAARGVRGLKEALAGISFALGVGIPALVGPQEAGVAGLGAVAIFAAACWWNCRLIDRWETGTRFARVETLGIAALAAFGLLVSGLRIGAAPLLLFPLFAAIHAGVRDRRTARVILDLAMAGLGLLWWAMAR